MIAGLVALLVATASGPEASPDRALLDAFRAACHRVDQYDSMKADAASSGWEEVAEDADPRIGRLNRTGREAVGDEGTARGASFRRTLGGRAVFLIVSRYEDRSGFWGNGCRLYDFDAPAALPRATLDGWMGRPSTGEQQLPENGGHKHLWEPGWRDGVGIEINHVPASSPFVARFGLSGNILVAQAIGGF